MSFDAGTKPLRIEPTVANLSSMTLKSTDKATVEGFLKGDPRATGRVNEYLDRGLAEYRDRLGYEADDVKSVAMLKLYNYLEAGIFRYECNLSALVWRIVSNVAIDFLRKRRVRRAEDIDMVERPDEGSNPEEILIRKEDVQIGFKIVMLMSEECRELWRLLLIDGLSGLEVAQKLGWTHEKVRQKKFACKEKANELLRKMTKDD